jgi:hypothetical protein
MARLIPAERGNGKRPSDPAFARSDQPSAIPVLDISDSTHELVGRRHAAALDPDNDAQLLTGTVVLLDNPAPRNSPGTPDRTIFRIGGSTLHEAATEVINAFEDHAAEMPAWVASTDADLAAVIAEHFTVDGYSECRVIDLEEVPA